MSQVLNDSDTATQNIIDTDTEPQKKKMKFISIYFLGINGIIGSGIFLLPQQIYQHMALMSVLVLVIAAITVSMIALCYADLSSRFQGSGSAWLYTYNAFGKFTGFQVGIFAWFLGILTISAEVIALLRILKNVFPIFHESLWYYVFALGLVIILALVNLKGTKLVTIIDNISSGAKIISLILFIAIGIFFMKSANFTPVVPESAHTFDGLVVSFGAAFSVVFYMFTGFSFIPIAARQMNNPQKNIPKALILVMISVTILYALVQLIAIGILGPSMSNYDIPIAVALQHAIGEWGYYLIIMFMCVSIFGVAFAVSFTTPYLSASLANEHNLFPKFLGKKNKSGAPYISIIMTTIAACILCTQNYLFLVACIVLASFIQYVPTILAVIKFKKTGEFPNQGFKLKGGYFIPILALLISAYLLTNFDITVFIVAIIVFVIGIILYIIADKYNKKSLQKNNE